MIEMSMTMTDASASTRAAVELSGYSTNSQTFHVKRTRTVKMTRLKNLKYFV